MSGISMEDLKKEASEVCVACGHTMGRWHDHEWYKASVQFAHCLVCDAQVVCRDHPAPNEIDVGGEAVASNCPSSDITCEGYVVCVSPVNHEVCPKPDRNYLDFIVGARYGWRRSGCTFLVQPKRGVDHWREMPKREFDRCFEEGK